ncbi:hypothetical protein GCM10010393_52310 [Streptomyces gobitricini]|uniref:Glycosyltransferase 2-like domain-containing protein n=1 Tax=Streptomyces gobitricini TaxID=68211 RepID=A0ABN3N2W0_9ACTN
MNDGGQRRYGPLGRALVIIPTYNEAENIKPIVSRVRAAVPDVDVLVADDNSPDGTGKLADELAAADDHVHVLHRKGKEGLGAAYLAGFRWGIERGYGVLVEMDADGSHQPEELPRLLTALKGADLVLGSRWVPGGRVVNWPKSREFLSRGGSTYSRILLDVPIRDVTGGFRAFRKETLEGLGLDAVASQGYCFQVDLARRAVAAGYHVVEVPITFVERELGDSKMSRDIVVEALWRVTAWGLGSRADRLLGRTPSTPAPGSRPSGPAPGSRPSGASVDPGAESSGASGGEGSVAGPSGASGGSDSARSAGPADGPGSAGSSGPSGNGSSGNGSSGPSGDPGAARS